MAQRGICSRREADRYIEKGLVFVDGERISELGTKILPDQEIRLDAKAESQQTALVTILINKPIGYVSNLPEDDHKPAVDLIKPETHWTGDKSMRKFHPTQLHGIAPAGRLDIDSVGLLVLTQDGRVARQLIGEDSSVDKEYLVRVTGELDSRGLQLLNHGLCLDGKELKPANVVWQNDDQLRFVLHEGKKRQIRRMCELVGLKVTGLKRIRIGNVMLGNLPEGQWRYLGSEERF
ncbi:MAG: rRNA pseudouridine synthase [Kiritimatiellales bacterium]|nr:rRNA pseudouridine synthase [Kiritimatiellales bacterium]